MNIVEMAKDLIKKGTQLNDPELIKMGQDMLNNHTESEPEVKVDFTKDIDPEGEVELKPPVEIVDSNYICTNCGHELESEKPRKRCPQCRKHKLVPKEPDTIEEPPPMEEGTAPIFTSESRGKKVKYDDNGEPVGVYARRQPINLKNTTYNRFIDDGESFNDDENEYLKTKAQTPRTRRQYKPIKVRCVRCGKDEMVPHVLAARSEYLCNKCILRGSRV